jgi:hypothetical protein
MSEDLKVFILGPARSGTSAMFYAMQTVFGLDGDGESHIMPGFQRVVFTFARYAEGFRGAEGVMANRLDPYAFRQLVMGHVRIIYGQMFPGGAFVDKTPGAEAIAGTPLIRDCFPQARIIVMRRSGIEVVQSHIKKFGAGFEESCRAWAASMGAIREIQGIAQDVLELDQHDLANAPEDSAAQVAAYLGHSESMSELATYFETNRMDSVAEYKWGTQSRLADMRWTDQEKQMFQDICGWQMEAFGYRF